MKTDAGTEELTKKLIPYERYTLTLTHEFFTEDGERCVLDEPVKVNYTMMSNTAVPFCIALNDMIERMAHYILQQNQSHIRGNRNDRFKGTCKRPC